MQAIPTSRALVPIKRRTGRPTLYDETYCDRVVELGRDGCSKAEIAAEIGVHRETLDEWAKRYPMFSDAMRYAKQLELAWWERAGRNGIGMGKDFNAAAYCFQMKNRFRADYADRVENTHKLDASTAFVEMMRAISDGRARALATA